MGVVVRARSDVWKLTCSPPQVDHLHNFIFFRFSMGFVDSLIAKCKCVCVCVSVEDFLPGLRFPGSGPPG